MDSPRGIMIFETRLMLIIETLGVRDGAKSVVLITSSDMSGCIHYGYGFPSFEPLVQFTGGFQAVSPPSVQTGSGSDKVETKSATAASNVQPAEGFHEPVLLCGTNIIENDDVRFIALHRVDLGCSNVAPWHT